MLHLNFMIEQKSIQPVILISLILIDCLQFSNQLLYMQQSNNQSGYLQISCKHKLRLHVKSGKDTLLILRCGRYSICIHIELLHK